MANKKKRDLVERWLKEADAFKATQGIPVGASVFDEWIRGYLKGRAAMAIQDPENPEGLRAALRRIAEEEVKAHNALRARDIHWQRPLRYMDGFIEQLVEECKRNDALQG
jgi:hypothetical protein